jgi:hypothetical protein
MKEAAFLKTREPPEDAMILLLSLSAAHPA